MERGVGLSIDIYTYLKVHVALSNGLRSFVVAGPPQSLYGLNVSLRRLKKGASGDTVNQDRIPFSQRKAKFNARFLPISVPFHSPYLNQVPALVQKDISRCGIVFRFP